MFHRSTPAHVRPRKKRLNHKKKFLILLVAPLFFGGVAMAYFALSQATSHVNVASPPNFMISIAQPTGTPLSPGNGMETVLFSVINQQPVAQTITTATYALTTDANGGVYDTNTNAYVDTCQASWFTITGTLGSDITLPLTVPGNDPIYTGTITVTMPTNTTTDQSSCSGLAPQVSVTLS